jgi:hypothetical protein
MSPHIVYFLAPKMSPNGDIRGQLLRMINPVLRIHARVRRREGARDLRDVLIASESHMR